MSPTNSPQVNEAASLRPERPNETQSELPVRRILLLDVNADRRLSRAKALETKGASVDCAGTGSDAHSLWQQGTHQLVLVEFGSAGSEFDEFCEYLQNTSRRQRVAYYIAEPPYVTSSRRRVEASRRSAEALASRPLVRPSPGQLGASHTGARRHAESPQVRRTTFGEAIKLAEKRSGQNS